MGQQYQEINFRKGSLILIDKIDGRARIAKVVTKLENGEE